MSRKICIRHAFQRRARAFLADAKGLAAVELAMILPLALMLMSLVVFGGQAYGVQRRVTLAATTVADIFAQANNTNVSTITAAELNQILAYPNLILYPYAGSSAAVVVSQLLVTVTRTALRPAQSRAAGPTPTEQLALVTSNCRSIRRSPPPFLAAQPILMSFSARLVIRSSRPESISRWARSPCTTRSS